MRSLSMSYVLLFANSGQEKKLNSEYDISFVALYAKWSSSKYNNNYDIMQCTHLPSG